MIRAIINDIRQLDALEEIAAGLGILVFAVCVLFVGVIIR